jgi:hypothetical protein
MIKRLFLHALLTISISCLGKPVLSADNDPSLPPLLLSTDIIEQTASQCRKIIDQLWEKRRTLSIESLRTFQIAIGEASRNCEELEGIYAQLKRAPVLKDQYDKTLKQAQEVANSLDQQ